MRSNLLFQIRDYWWFEFTSLAFLSRKGKYVEGKNRRITGESKIIKGKEKRRHRRVLRSFSLQIIKLDCNYNAESET